MQLQLMLENICKLQISSIRIKLSNKLLLRYLGRDERFLGEINDEEVCFEIIFINI